MTLTIRWLTIPALTAALTLATIQLAAARGGGHGGHSHSSHSSHRGRLCTAHVRFRRKADITRQGRLSSSTRRANSTGSTMAHAIMPIAARRPAASQYVNCCVETEVCEATSATRAPSKNMNVMVTGTNASRGKTERVIAAKTAVTTSEAANSMRGPVIAFCSARMGDRFVR